MSMLLHEDDTLTPEGEQILDSLFDRFDADKDGAWNFAELRKYNDAIEAPPLEEDAVAWLSARFDIDMNGYLTRTGFKELVVYNVHENPEQLYEDLKALGFGHMLGRKEVKAVENIEAASGGVVVKNEEDATGRRVSVVAVGLPTPPGGGNEESKGEAKSRR